MKTATVTWVTYHNYGTALQAYALQQHLLRCGVENTILSDRQIVDPPVEKKAAPSLWRRLRHPRALLLQLHQQWKQAQSRRRRKPYWDSEARIAAFKEEKLQILKDLSKEDLPRLNDRFDAFICGSDQIWSVFDCLYNPYFYLDFVTGKKVAYAPSMGTDDIPPQRQEEIRRLLKDFSAVSVRERQSAQVMSALLERSVDWVADPTLLHDKAFWEDFARDAAAPKGKYLLCYFLSNRDWYFSYAKNLAAKLGLQAVILPGRADILDRKGIYRQSAGPEEFVALVKHAGFVLTDSYHGTIFALGFEKPFLHLQRFEENEPLNQNIRIRSLMERLGLEKHILCRKEFAPEDIREIDYPRVSALLEAFRQHSREYIRKHILE